MNVITNAAPRYGIFNVAPKVGFALSTQFRFSTSNWTDPHTPLKYRFAYISPTDASILLPVTSAAGSLTASSILPLGSTEINNTIIVVVQATDSLGATANASVGVTVRPLYATNALPNIVQGLLAAAYGNSETILQVISVGASALSGVNCVSAATCAALNRQQCTSVPHTCGACITGYSGTVGNSNDLCSSLSSHANAITNSRCSKASDCSPLQVCDSGACVSPPKQCLDPTCSGHGTCLYINSHDGGGVVTCLADDSTCLAVCFCGQGYYDPMCRSNSTELEASQSAKHLLLASLSNVTSGSHAVESAENVQAWVSVLSELTQNPYQLTPSSSGTALDIASNILAASSRVEIPYSAIQGVLGAIDLASQATTSVRPGRRLSTDEATSANLNLANKTATLLGTFANIVTSQMYPGQPQVDIMLSSFAMTLHVLSSQSQISSSSLVLPIPAVEQAAGRDAPLVTVGGTTGNVKVSAVSIKSRVYRNSGMNYTSDIMRVHTTAVSSSSKRSSLNSEVLVILQNNRVTEFISVKSNETFVSQCKRGVKELPTYTCHVSNFVITHNCTGEAESLISSCPSIEQASSCSSASVGALGSSACRLISYTATNTTCACKLQQTKAVRVRRRLQGSAATEAADAFEETGLVDAVSMTTYIAGQFAATLAAATQFNSVESLEKVMTVIVMFAALWGGGLVLLCFLYWQDQAGSVATIKEKLMKQISGPAQGEGEGSSAGNELKNYLVTYIGAVFPSVFSSKSLLQRFRAEISNNHPYLNVFFKTKNMSENDRTLTGIKLMTIQTFLMFLLALLYDLQAPDDDGTCAHFVTQETCLARKSMLDHQQTYCQWVPDSSLQCTYQ